MKLPAQEYLMGSNDAELARLTLLGAHLEPITRRLIRDSGITLGMRVLDIGCGMGDVSMLLAEAVGAAGHVVAIDREEQTIAAASARARQSGYDCIEFVRATDEEISGLGLFEAAIGRYILFHQRDPVSMVRRAAEVVRPGGVVAFQEMVLAVESAVVPPLELWARLVRAAVDTGKAGMPSPDTGARLTPIFEEAGLPVPQVFCECSIGGWDSAIVPLLVMTYQTMLPAIDRLGLKRADVGDLETLRDRLVREAQERGAQFISNPEACAWAIRPRGRIPAD